MNTPVNFELAKLLKEKGFDNPCENRYNELGELTATKLGMNMQPNNYSDSYSAPTLGAVIMWLYEEHSLWILPIPTVTGHFAYKILDVQLDPENEIERPPYTGVSAMDYNLPTEAYEAAIEYVLTKILG